MNVENNLLREREQEKSAGAMDEVPVLTTVAPADEYSLKRIFILEGILLLPWLIFVFPAWMALAYGSVLGILWFFFAGAFLAYPVIALASGFAAVEFKRKGDGAMAVTVATAPIACLVPFGLLMLFR
jgi:hypothetical protein